MKTPTPDRSVEELRNKILDIETAVRLTYNEKDSDQMLDKLLNHYTKALKAERQRCDEMVELERHKIKLRIDYDRRKSIPAEETVQDIYDSIELKATQPNN